MEVVAIREQIQNLTVCDFRKDTTPKGQVQQEAKNLHEPNLLEGDSEVVTSEAKSEAGDNDEEREDRGNDGEELEEAEAPGSGPLTPAEP